jgi:uncharacterized protein YneF (UPF0154 family)
MKTGSATAFAKFREEIQLWPAAVMAFIVTEHGSIGALVLFGTLVFTGATTYRLHETVRKGMMASASSREQEVREVNSRDGVYNPSETHIKNILNFSDALVPKRRIVRIIVLLAILANLAAGLWLFGWLMGRVLGPAPPTVTVMGLVSLPLLMIATTVASLLWNL